MFRIADDKYQIPKRGDTRFTMIKGMVPEFLPTNSVTLAAHARRGLIIIMHTKNN